MFLEKEWRRVAEWCPSVVPESHPPTPAGGLDSAELTSAGTQVSHGKRRGPKGSSESEKPQPEKQGVSFN